MIRNSSFFWASDALRNEEDDDDDEKFSDENESGDEDISHVDFFLAGEAAAAAAPKSGGIPQPPTTVVDEESHPLVQGTQNDGYGSGTASNHGQRERRILFPHPEEPRSPSRSPRSTRRKKEVTPQELRFQVVIWHVGAVDVCHGHVAMRFRITLFWNDTARRTKSRSLSLGDESERSQQAKSEWSMKGRQRACRYDLNEEAVEETVDVPPVSILNAVSFETVGDAEVAMLDSKTRFMRWTCMYSAVLFQGDHMRVDQFPHDKHDLKVKIGILANRGHGRRWDKSVYKLALATEEDSQGSTKIPYGLIVDHCTIPDFVYDPDGLSFAFVPLLFGSGKQHQWIERDRYLEVQLPVYRSSGHYDRSIMPILALLNIVAITCLPRNFDSATASTETMLSIAFVQVGIRLTIDSRLPSVGYQIKFQKVLNQCFWLICGLVLESNVVFFLVTKMGWEIAETDLIDVAAACIALFYTGYILVLYYGGRTSEYHLKVQ